MYCGGFGEADPVCPPLFLLTLGEDKELMVWWDRSVRDLVGELDFSFHVISRLSEKEVEKRIA